VNVAQALVPAYIARLKPCVTEFKPFRAPGNNLAELKFFGYLSDIVGHRKIEIGLEKPIPLREMLPSQFPETNMIILINEKVGSLDSSIKNEDSVVLMPILSGG
jgi:molybdopterin converting factor small subunit